MCRGGSVFTKYYQPGREEHLTSLNSCLLYLPVTHVAFHHCKSPQVAGFKGSGVFLISVQDYLKKFPCATRCLPSTSRIHSVVSLRQTLQVLVLSFITSFLKLFKNEFYLSSTQQRILHLCMVLHHKFWILGAQAFSGVFS